MTVARPERSRSSIAIPGGDLAANNPSVSCVPRDPLADSAAAEGEDSIHERATALACDHDAVQVATQSASCGRVTQRHLTIAQDGSEEIVEVVRDAAGERPHRFETLSLAQLVFHPLQLLFGEMAIGHIEHEPEQARGFAFRLEEHPCLRLRPP